VTVQYVEQGVVFDSGDHRLVGISTIPETCLETGILVLVGGPQYRVGSHRQFTLLARSLAGCGIASFRFDFSGMGDSEGERREFFETLEDITAAIDTFLKSVPGVSRVVLWGLCDAASSAMMYAHRDSRISGLILLNPWVHTGEYAPEVKLAHFYLPFFSSKGKWRYLVSSRNKIVPTLREVGRDTLALIGRRSGPYGHSPPGQHFIQGMLEGLGKFGKNVLIVLSEDDLTASEFSALIARDSEWKKIIESPAITLRTVAAADHTFSRKAWKDEVSRLTIDWVNEHSARS